MGPVTEERARRWMWIALGIIAALQLYFVWELLAAFFLFVAGFAVLAGVVFAFYFLHEAGQASLSWVEERSRAMTAAARRGLVDVEALSKKPFRRPRSETAQ